jgi:mRNA N6-methyladenine demethylase
MGKPKRKRAPGGGGGSSNWEALKGKLKKKHRCNSSEPSSATASNDQESLASKSKKKKKKKKKKKRESNVVPAGEGSQTEGTRVPNVLPSQVLQKSKKRKKQKDREGSKAGKSVEEGPRGRAATLKQTRPPKPYHPHDKGSKFFYPNHPEFDGCVKQSYRGFLHAGTQPLPGDLHGEVLASLECMRESGVIFHHDVVAAGKAAVSGTMCKRTLLGDVGMTYHYQKLRIFAIPWEQRGNSALSKAIGTIRKMNKALTRHAKKYAKMGSCNYNVALINYMEPNGRKFPLRDEPAFGMGKMSVSWHADSSLQKFSTIGVYHVTGSTRDDWVIASRVTNDSTSPAVAVPLKRQDSYFMLDDFNHHHQHAVLAGSSWRYSSTHRVAVVVKDTWDYIRTRAERAADMSRKIAARLEQCERRMTERQDPALAREARDAMDPKALREIGSIGEEIEFEWLCMFFLQGSTHAQSHSGHWLPNIEALEKMWCTIDRGIAACLRFLKDHGDRIRPLQRTLQIVGWLLKERLTKRNEYYKRTKHTAYKQLEAGWQPIPNRPADGSGEGIALARDLRNDVEFVNTMLQKGMYVKA